MYTMKNKKLKELLKQYPDDSIIKLEVNSRMSDISSITVEYYEGDEYAVPDIIICGIN